MNDPMDSPTIQAQAAPQAPPRKRGGGPRTLLGKRVSCANALKDSLASKTVFTPEMAAAIVERTRIFAQQYRPQNDYESMLISDMAVAKAQWDHATELLIRDYARCIDRAYQWWDVDHEERAIDISKRLERDCQKSVHTLGWTKKGAELLISFWEGLGEALQSNGDWDEPQRRLCYDLLAIRPELRSGSKQVPPSGDTTGMAALVKRQIQKLRDRIEDCLAQEHLADQAATASGFLLHEDAVTKKYRRYAAGHRSDYYKALGLLLSSRAEAEAAGAGTADTGLFPPFPPKTSDAGFDFLFQRYQAIAASELDRLKPDEGPGDDPTDPGGDDAARDRETPRATAAVKTRTVDSPVKPGPDGTPAPASRPEPELRAERTAASDPAATSTSPPVDDAPRPMSGRARKLRERRLRDQAKAAKRAARKAARSGR